MLNQLLTLAEQDPQTERLAAGGGRAFVSQALRPYLLAALLQRARGRPAIVVAGDDRQARNLAAALRAWLAPRTVRFYPSRGVTYESHLAPPPHLVGLRVAALDALLGWDGRRARSAERAAVGAGASLAGGARRAGKGAAGDDAAGASIAAVGTGDGAAGDGISADDPGAAAPVVVVSAVALSEKVPDPSLRPQSFTLRRGELIDLDETALELVAAGYERVEQVEDRGQFAIRGGLLDLFPATEDRAVRVDLFGDEIESLRWFSTFTQRSLEDAEEVEIAPAAELAPEHRELAEIAALEDAAQRPDIAELLPVEQFRELLELAGAEAEVLIAAEEDIQPAISDHWQDVCAAFRDQDAHHLYVAPEPIAAALTQRARIRLAAVDSDQPFQFRAQSADFAARGLSEAEPELEKLLRSGYRTVVTFPQRGEGERMAYNLGRLLVRWLDGDAAQTGPPPGGPDQQRLLFARARLEQGFIAPQFKLAVIPEHRLLRRRRAPERPGAGRGRRGVLRSFAELRSGDIVVHEDHGIARFAGFDTKTVAGVTRDYLPLESAG